MSKYKQFFSYIILVLLFVPIMQVSAEARAAVFVPQSSYPHNRVLVVQNSNKGPVPFHDILEEYKSNSTGTYELKYSGQHYVKVNKNILILAWGSHPEVCAGMEGCNSYAFRIANPGQYTISTGNGDDVGITGISDH